MNPSKQKGKKSMWGKDFHKMMIDYTCASESPFKFPLNSGEEILKIKKVIIVIKVRKKRSGGNNKQVQ